MEFGDVHGRLFCDPDLQDLDAIVEIIALVVSDVETATESTKVLGIVNGMSKRISFFHRIIPGTSSCSKIGTLAKLNQESWSARRSKRKHADFRVSC